MLKLFPLQIKKLQKLFSIMSLEQEPYIHKVYNFQICCSIRTVYKYLNHIGIGGIWYLNNKRSDCENKGNSCWGGWGPSKWVLMEGGCQRPAVLPWDVWVCPTSELSKWGRIWMRILGNVYGPSTKLRFPYKDASYPYEVVAYSHTSTPHFCPSLLLVLDKGKHKKEMLETELWNSVIEKRGAGEGSLWAF